MNRVTRTVLLVTILTYTNLFIPISSFAQPALFETVRSEYQLPYEGILPDNPLYFFKKMRDELVQFGTRDMLKKAEVYLLTSDKQVAAARSLQQKGKIQLSLETLSEAEKNFAEIPTILQQSKQQGVSPSTDFLNLLHQSNLKHKEIINEMMKLLPADNENRLKEILDMNNSSAEQLKKLS